MKYEAIKKHGEQWVRIRPALQVYNESAVLKETIEDMWWLCDISGSENTAKLQSRDTQHSRYIGLDQIHHYMSDPEAKGDRANGMLVLNVQLLLLEGKLLAEPVAPPGTPLKHFVPARTRETLYTTAARAAAAATLMKRRREYDWSAEGVQAARRAFEDFGSAFKTLEQDLTTQGHKVPIQIRQSGWGFLVGACGWWLILSWQQKAGNVIEDGLLTIRKFDGVPSWPGILSLGEAHQVTVDQYTFGLVTLDEARWISRGNTERSYTTMDLATKVLTELIERPNDRIR